MAKLAIILHQGSPGTRELRLAKILDFFGVPSKMVDASMLADVSKIPLEYAVLGSVQSIAAALKCANEPIPRADAFYMYADDDRGLCGRALQFLLGGQDLSLWEVPSGNLSFRVCGELADLTGPFAGLEFPSRLSKEAAVLVSALVGSESRFVPVIKAGNAPVFVRFHKDNVPVFFCTSSQMVDIDQPVGQGFYDVKDHFCSVVPLVMFLRLMFSDVAWRPQELGACLIIDDPLLKARYGFCDFAKLRDLMRRYGFTTNIAFIPWNWRRTSPAAGDFFGREPGLFSVSIHGCDHTGGEFGATSIEVLDDQARLAQSRMRNHEARTGIQHDPIMVFPQGIFSSGCPEVLKRNSFLGAVNTETDPVDFQNARTRIRDVWDVAIMRYVSFPIFTRRYAFHGLENFAFDLLLGKPCLIVAHHDFLKDGGAGLIGLIENLQSLNCRLRWRPLGDVVRRACRRRVNDAGAEEVEMYGNDLLIDNSSDQAIEVRIRKSECQGTVISQVFCEGKPIPWRTEDEHLVFGEQIRPRSNKCFRVVYRVQPHAGRVRRSLPFGLSVAARRVVSEFRDEYLSRAFLLNANAATLKSVIRKSPSAIAFKK